MKWTALRVLRWVLLVAVLVITAPILLLFLYLHYFEVKLALMRNRMIDLPDARYESMVREAQALLADPPPTSSRRWRFDAVYERGIDPRPPPYFADFDPRRVSLSPNTRQVDVDLAWMADHGGGFWMHQHDGVWVVDGGFGANCAPEQFWPRDRDAPLVKSWYRRCKRAPD